MFYILFKSLWASSLRDLPALGINVVQTLRNNKMLPRFANYTL